MPQGRVPARGQMGAPVSTCHPPPPSASPLTPPLAICADLPLAVNSSRAGCGVPAAGVAGDNTAVQMLSGQKDGDGGDSKANICAPSGNNRAALCKKASRCDTVSMS